MHATAIVSSDNKCGANLVVYTECPGNHRHAFSDPSREGRLYVGHATLQVPNPEVMARINDWWADH